MTGMFALCSATVAQTRWDLPSGYSTGDFHTENLVRLAGDVERETAGRLKITVYANATLFKAPEIKRAVQGGQAPIGEVLLANHADEWAIFGADSIPFLAEGYDASMRLYRAQRPLIEQRLAQEGMILLYSVPWPPQGVYTRKPVESAADLRRFKWRAYNPATARIAELVGAQPVTIQAAELPQALATGVVNAFMTSGSTGYDSKAWESMTHFYDTQAWIPKNVTFVNKAAFDALDKPTQEAILKAAAAAEARGWKAWEEKANWYLDQLKAKGMKVLAPSDALAGGFKKVGEQLTADWLKKAGTDGQAIVDAYKKM